MGKNRDEEGKEVESNRVLGEIDNPRRLLGSETTANLDAESSVERGDRVEGELGPLRVSRNIAGLEKRKGVVKEGSGEGRGWEENVADEQGDPRRETEGDQRAAGVL